MIAICIYFIYIIFVYIISHFAAYHTSLKHYFTSTFKACFIFMKDLYITHEVHLYSSIFLTKIPLRNQFSFISLNVLSWYLLVFIYLANVFKVSIFSVCLRFKHQSDQVCSLLVNSLFLLWWYFSGISKQHFRNFHYFIPISELFHIMFTFEIIYLISHVTYDIYL